MAEVLAVDSEQKASGHMPPRVPQRTLRLRLRSQLPLTHFCEIRIGNGRGRGEGGGKKSWRMNRISGNAITNRANSVLDSIQEAAIVINRAAGAGRRSSCSSERDIFEKEGRQNRCIEDWGRHLGRRNKIRCMRHLNRTHHQQGSCRTELMNEARGEERRRKRRKEWQRASTDTIADLGLSRERIDGDGASHVGLSALETWIRHLRTENSGAEGSDRGA